MGFDYTATTKGLTDFFSQEETYKFVEAMAKLNAHYYRTLVAEGVPAEAAAIMAANYRATPAE